MGDILRSAPSPAELVKTVYERLNCKFVNAYGSAEGSRAMTRLDDDFETVCTTMGKKDCPYNQFKIVGRYEQEVTSGKEGQLITNGPTISTRYFKSTDENKQIFTRDGFFKTGDLARIDDDRRIMITGRIKETILRGGETISAVGIERLISSRSSVADVAVIGMPNKNLGERICAYIQVKSQATLTFQAARRLGARDVTVVYRRSRNEMPAYTEEVAAAEKESRYFQRGGKGRYLCRQF